MMHHHSHSPAMRLVGSISWLITSLAAIAWGLIGLGNSMHKNWNIWEMDFVVNNLQWLVLPAQYIVGFCGVVALVSWFMCMSCDHKK
jgi:uncharacterized membrane protein YuzA (DUF378 family)